MIFSAALLLLPVCAGPAELSQLLGKPIQAYEHVLGKATKAKSHRILEDVYRDAFYSFGDLGVLETYTNMSTGFVEELTFRFRGDEKITAEKACASLNLGQDLTFDKKENFGSATVVQGLPACVDYAYFTPPNGDLLIKERSVLKVDKDAEKNPEPTLTIEFKLPD